MRHFHGQQVPGELFHFEEVVILPAFSEVESETSADGQIELDAIGEGRERWVVEVKWRNKRTGVKELEKLQRHARERSARGWFVSRAVFFLMPSTAVENGFCITDKENLEALRQLILAELLPDP